MSVGAELRAFWHRLDQLLGRGSYRWIKPWLAPYQTYTYSAYAASVARLARPGIRWLDAGCGHQILESRLENEEKEIVGKAKLAVGCDACTDSLRRHRSLEKLVSCSVDRLPFREASFDLVTLNMVAEHLLDPQRTFAEIARVLQTGGLLLIHTPNASSYEVQMIRWGWKVVPKSVGLNMIRFLEHREPEDVFPTFYRANTRKQMSRLAPQAGLAEVEFQLIEDRPFFYFVAPLCALQILVAKLLRAVGREEFCSGSFLACYQKSPNGSPSISAGLPEADRSSPDPPNQQRRPLRSAGTR
jgi:ubiquinone/menaquinone biosynthesis C-methylase UbiE